MSTFSQRMSPADMAPSTTQPPSDGMAAAATRFSTLSSDFRLPARGKALNSTGSPGPGEAETAASSLASAGGGMQHPLLRRSAVAAAAYVTANRARLRRGSMLGHEIARSTSSMSSSDEDEDMGSDVGLEGRHMPSLGAKSPSPGQRASEAAFSNGRPHSQSPEAEDIGMQLETGDVSLENVKLESKSRPSTPPPSEMSSTRSRHPSESFASIWAHSQAKPGLSASASRRNLAKRLTTPRDRDVQRVAASLKDESRPSDNEIASEAKLQRYLGPGDEVAGPSTPRLLAVGAPSPRSRSVSSSGSFFGQVQQSFPNGDRSLADDDYVFHDNFVMDDDISTSDEDEAQAGAAMTTLIATPAGATSTRFEDSNGDDGSLSNSKGVAIPETSHRDVLWLGFRETTPGARGSPGTEKTLSRSYRSSNAPPGFGSPAPSSYPDKSGVEIEMLANAGTSSANQLKTGAHVGGGWGKTIKRKLVEERYDPYSTSLHKRRAVSPIASLASVPSPTLHTDTSGSGTNASTYTQRVRASTPTASPSPALVASQPPQLSPLATHIASHFTGPGPLPVPTPLQMPSPTLAITQRQFHSTGVGTLSKAISLGAGCTNGLRTVPPNAISGAEVGTGPSSNVSPASTRPSTPTGYVPAAPRSASHGLGFVTTPGAVMSGNPFFLNSGPNSGPASSGPSSTATATQSAANATGGSGPGYGSGALGLSIGSRRFKEEQEEQEEEEGMLGDVSAIRLGDM